MVAVFSILAKSSMFYHYENDCAREQWPWNLDDGVNGSVASAPVERYSATSMKITAKPIR